MASKTIHSAAYRRLVAKLRALREERGISQSDLAKQLGWPQQRLSAVEAGARRIDIIEFLALTAALGLTPQAAIKLAAGPSRSK